MGFANQRYVSIQCQRKVKCQVRVCASQKLFEVQEVVCSQVFGCRYIGPYEVLERIRPVAYRLPLPPSISRVYNVFHISQLGKCIADLDAAIETNQPKVQPNLTMPEYLMKILHRVEKTLRRKLIPSSEGLVERLNRERSNLGDRRLHEEVLPRAFRLTW